MSSRLADSGQATALVLVGLMLLAVPTGLAAVEGLSTPTASQSTIPTVTPPMLGSPTPTSTSTPMATPTPTDSNQSPHGDDNTLVVDGSDGDLSDGAPSEEDCPEAKYENIQDAVNDATRGDTVVVCEGSYNSVDIQTPNITLRAHGAVEIIGTGQPAVRTNAPRVTLRGFTITTEQANHTIEIGGRETRIENTTITVTKNESETGTEYGIFLSDGRTSEVTPDSELGAATQSRILNSTFEVRAPADSEPAIGIWADADGTTIRDNSFTGSGNATSIYSTGNETVIRNNTLRYDSSNNPFERPGEPWVKIGAHSPQLKQSWEGDDFGGANNNNIAAPERHNWASQNLIVNNFVHGGGAVSYKVANKTVFQNNTFSLSGIRVRSNKTLIRNNILSEAGGGVTIDYSFNVRVIENTLTGNNGGMWIYSANNVTVKRNLISENPLYGGVLLWQGAENIFVVNNTITDNQNGIIVDYDCFRDEGVCGKSKNIQIHRNRIRNNDQLGIWNRNYAKDDDLWWVVNATRNYWGCGGPSSGLRDPVTNRTANGTGDRLSASDEPGIANVHFDPFFVRQDLNCPSAMSNPTPTQTATPTLTPTTTSTPTPTPMPTPTPAALSGNDTDGTGGTGTGGTGSGTNGSESTGGPGKSGSGGATTTATASPSTATPTLSPTSTISPTPVVEPGFGTLGWFVGAAILAGLVALRRQMTLDSKDTHD